jgi:hypothetical protein
VQPALSDLWGAVHLGGRPNQAERLAGADMTKTIYDCRPSPLGGFVCAADCVAQCRIEVRAMTETCG